MMRPAAAVLLAALAAGSAAAQVVPPVATDLVDALARVRADVATRLIARQFGDAYVADWWNATEAVLASAVRQARYLGEEGPSCLAKRAREGDASSAFVTCSAGLDEAKKQLDADLGQIAAIVPDWERMARQIDAANATVTPQVDRALAAIDAARRALMAGRY